MNILVVFAVIELRFFNFWDLACLEVFLVVPRSSSFFFNRRRIIMWIELTTCNKIWPISFKPSEVIYSVKVQEFLVILELTWSFITWRIDEVPYIWMIKWNKLWLFGNLSLRLGFQFNRSLYWRLLLKITWRRFNQRSFRCETLLSFFRCLRVSPLASLLFYLLIQLSTIVIFLLLGLLEFEFFIMLKGLNLLVKAIFFSDFLLLNAQTSNLTLLINLSLDPIEKSLVLLYIRPQITCLICWGCFSFVPKVKGCGPT